MCQAGAQDMAAVKAWWPEPVAAEFGGRGAEFGGHGAKEFGGRGAEFGEHRAEEFGGCGAEFRGRGAEFPLGRAQVPEPAFVGEGLTSWSRLQRASLSSDPQLAAAVRSGVRLPAGSAHLGLWPAGAGAFRGNQSLPQVSSHQLPGCQSPETLGILAGKGWSREEADAPWRGQAGSRPRGSRWGRRVTAKGGAPAGQRRRKRGAGTPPLSSGPP